MNMYGVGVSQRIYASTTCRFLRHLKVGEVKRHWKQSDDKGIFVTSTSRVLSEKGRGESVWLDIDIVDDDCHVTLGKHGPHGFLT